MAATAEQIRIVLSNMATKLEPNTLALDVAKAELAHLTAIKNIASTMEARIARRIADAGEPQRSAFPSAEAWHADNTGTTASKAKEHLDTAARLENLDDVAAAANTGEISAEQAAIIADGAEHNPGAQKKLLNVARQGSIRELRQAADQAKAAGDGDDAQARHDRIRAERKLVFSRKLDGAAAMFGVTTPDQMATVKAAVEKRANQLFQAARREGRRERREAYAIDALAQICAEFLDGGSNPLTTTDTEPTTTAPKSSSGPPWLGILRLDVAAMRRGKVEGDELCEIAGIGAIPVQRARELLGDAVLKLVLTDGVDVVNVTHLGRGPTVAQKVALLWQEPLCGITACPRIMGIEHDHHTDWADVHVTELRNLRRRCEFHHDQKSRGWAEIEHPDGTITIVPPDHRDHPRNRSRGPDPPGWAE